MFFEYCGVSRSAIGYPHIRFSDATDRSPIEAPVAEFREQLRLGSARSLAPDLAVFLLVAVRGIINAAGAAIALDVGRREQVDGSGITARRLAREGAIELVDHLEAVQPQRFGHRADLILIGLDALEGRFRPISRRDVPRLAVARYAGRLQGRRPIVE